MQPSKELTFDYQDIKEVLDTMNITINDVYFGVSATSPSVINVWMYWISPASKFNCLQEIGSISGLYVQIKGKWFPEDDLDAGTFDGDEKLTWIRSQEHVNCACFVDGTGSSSIGSHQLSH